MSRKTALVISGGGAKGAFAAGVIRDLFQRFRDTGWFSIVGGTSVGSLIAPLAAVMAAPGGMGREALKTLVDLFSSIRTEDILRKRRMHQLLRRQDSLHETDPLNKLLRRRFEPEWFEWLQSDEAPDCYVVYVNFQTGQKMVVSPKDGGMTRGGFRSAMRASCSIPVFMQGTVIDGELCFDGGVRDVIPFERAVELGAETIVPIYLDPRGIEPLSTPLTRMDQILRRTIALLWDETRLNDLELAKQVCIAVSAREQLREAFRDDESVLQVVDGILGRDDFAPLFGASRRLLHIVKGLVPHERLTHNSLHFHPPDMTRWMRDGEETARRVLKESPFV